MIVLNEQAGFKWAGLVDATGKVLHLGQLQAATPAPNPTTTLILTPSVTPFLTATLGLSTSTPVHVPFNDASFLEDVTIPDGTTFSPGKRFLKMWRLRNGGTCTWTSDYDLIFVGGNRMSAQRAVPLERNT